MPENRDDIERILKILPHRYPFLLVDKLVEVKPREEVHAIKNVTFNEPFFNGHFPGNPIMPGVLIIEALAQASAIMVAEGLGYEDPEVFFMTISNARFRKPVVPGDVLHLHVRTLQNVRNVWKCECEARVEGKKVTEAVMSAMIQDGKG